MATRGQVLVIALFAMFYSCESHTLSWACAPGQESCPPAESRIDKDVCCTTTVVYKCPGSGENACINMKDVNGVEYCVTQCVKHGICMYNEHKQCEGTYKHATCEQHMVYDQLETSTNGMQWFKVKGYCSCVAHSHEMAQDHVHAHIHTPDCGHGHDHVINMNQDHDIHYLFNSGYHVHTSTCGHNTHHVHTPDCEHHTHP